MTARYRVDFPGTARADLANARRWLFQPGSGVRAHQRYAAILVAIQDLKISPGRWPLEDHGVRQRTVGGYRMIYRLDEQNRTVVVLRIFGPFQDRSTS